jgi:hypothetical protein
MRKINGEEGKGFYITEEQAEELGVMAEALIDVEYEPENIGAFRQICSFVEAYHAAE